MCSKKYVGQASPNCSTIFACQRIGSRRWRSSSFFPSLWRPVRLAIAVCGLTGMVHAQSHLVRVACTQGPDLEHYNLATFDKAMDYAGKKGADLILLPEYLNGEMVQESMSGPSAPQMSKRAREYRMYVAGTIARQDDASKRVYNTALLFDREGKQVGSYDKIHLYGDELRTLTPGTTVPVFQTDFGKIAFVTCNDIAFDDVAATAAKQGARLLLFPNLGYNPAVPRVRASENGVWLVASSRSGIHNLWNGAGVDLMTTGGLAKLACRDVVEHQIDGMGILLATLDLNTTGSKDR